MNIVEEKPLPLDIEVDIYTVVKHGKTPKYYGRGYITKEYESYKEIFATEDENDEDFDTIVERVIYYNYRVRYKKVLNTGRLSKKWYSDTYTRAWLRPISIEDGVIIRA